MAKIKNKYLYKKNSFYHVYNRGNNKRLIFYDINDYERLVRKILEFEKDYDLNIYSYCLMPNHYHLLIKLGNDKNDISKYMQRLMTAYVMYFNKKYQNIGRLFQGPFEARRLKDFKDVVGLTQYLENNPVEAGLCKVSSDYRWLYISLNQERHIVRNEKILLSVVEARPNEDPGLMKTSDVIFRFQFVFPFYLQFFYF